MTDDKLVVGKVLKYTTVFELAEEGGYVVSVPALPGCVTQGENFEDAVEMARDAIQGYLEVLEEREMDIPTESGEVVVTKIAVDYPLQVAC